MLSMSAAARGSALCSRPQPGLARLGAVHASRNKQPRCAGGVPRNSGNRSSSCTLSAASSPGAPAAPRGALIVVEGLDRSGKSTLIQRLQAGLEQAQVETVFQSCPDRSADTSTGPLLAAHLDVTKDLRLSPDIAHLLFSLNRWERYEAVMCALQGGKTVIFDRYAYSGVAYTAAQGVDATWCQRPETGLPAPDLVVFLEIEPGMASTRPGYSAELYEKVAFQEKVRKAFSALREPGWVVVDASQPAEVVYQQVLAEALRAVERCDKGGCPINKLWG